MHVDFRAYVKHEKEVYPVSGLVLSDIRDCHEVIVTSCGNELGCCENEYSLDDVVMMQWTGMKDKHDHKIYEGDLLLINDRKVDEEDGAFLVYYEDYESRYVVSNLEEAFDLGTFFPHEVEVVGNVYDSRYEWYLEYWEGLDE